MQEDNRSTLVKRMFYKEGSQSNLRQRPGQNTQEAVHANAASLGSLPDSVQRLLEDKKEQLERAMKFYNSEQQKLNTQRMQYETQTKKLRQE